jgi:hypothetical protein
MSEIVDDMLNGELCSKCFAWIDGNYQGFPRKCDDCKPKHKSISDAKRLKLRKKRQERRKNKGSK